MTSRSHRRTAAWALAAALTLPACLLAAPGAVAEPAPSAPPAPAVASAKPLGDAAKLAKLRRSLRARFTSYAGAAPVSPNPALALLPPGARVDYQAWAAQAGRLSQARVLSPRHRRSGALSTLPGLTYAEQEGADERGFNDDAATAEPISGLGAGPGAEPAATILGELNAAFLPGRAYRAVRPNSEDDSGPDRARDLGVSARFAAAKTTGFSAKNDEDWYKLKLRSGQLLTIDLTATSGTLQPAAVLLDEDLNFVTDSFGQFGRKLSLDAAIVDSGTYYVVTFGWIVIGIPPNGPTTGDYELRVGARAGDTDTFAVDLEAGDVLAATTNADGWVNVFGPEDSDSIEFHGSRQDASFIFPAASPLPGARGRGLSEYVVREPGRYHVQYFGGDGPYVGRLEVYRYGGAGAAEPARVYLDFDGARVNTGIWGGWGVVELSAMSKFMPKWGLDRAQEADLIAAIKVNVEESVRADLAANGLSDTVEVEITTSLDGPDISGEPGVTRIIVGGSIRESGVPTIGIAQSIDPGNFERTETGLVLMDVLSGPETRYGGASLRRYLKPESDVLAFVAQGIGNVTSHEIGHMLGNWHTNNENPDASLMDAGGVGFGRLFGVGPDRIGGTADDADVDFVVDEYYPWEGFLGIEDTVTRSTFAMSN